MTTATKTQLTVDRSTHQMRVVRDFDAPRDLVWRALTNADLMPKWWSASTLC